MTCREARQRLRQAAGTAGPPGERQALEGHLEGCAACREVSIIERLSRRMMESLRAEIEPSPVFYARLRERLGAAGNRPAAASPLHEVWGVAWRWLPAMAAGVAFLAAVTVGLPIPWRPLAGGMAPHQDVSAFAFEEVSVPAVPERPSQDQMLAFVLMADDTGGAGSSTRSPRPGR
jgi:hypothetical protein